MSEEENWEEIVNELTANKKETYQRSMQIAATRSPDEHASVVNTARKLEIPPAILTPNNIAEAKIKAAEMENQYELLADIAPKTTKWLSNPDNSSLAKDDVKSLQEIEGMVHEHSFGANFGNTLGSGMASMNAMMLRTADAAIAAYQYPVNKAIQVFDLPYRQSSPRDLWDNSGAKNYEDQAKALAAQSDWLNINTEKAIANGDVKSMSKYLAAQVLANAPQQAINLVAAYSGVGIPSLVANGMGVSGQSVSESAEKGVAPTTAFEAGALKGTTEALFENLGTLGLFKKWEGAIHKSLGSGSYKEVMAAVAKTLAHSVAGEANEEGLTSLMQDFSDWATGNKPEALQGMLGRALESAAVGGLSGGAMTAPAAFIAASQRHMVKSRAESDRDHFLKLEEKLLESKLQIRDGQTMGSFIGEATKGSASENVYIDPRALNEYFEKKDIDAIEVMKGMGMIEKWNAAKESGSAMEIPTALILEKLAGTEHLKALANDVKFSPDGMSVNEAKIHEEDSKADEEQRRADMAEQAFADDEESKQRFNQRAAESKAMIRKDITDKLVAQGYTPEEAHTNSILFEKFFGTLEEDSGLDAEKLYTDFGPQILAGNFVLPDTEGGVSDKSIIQKIKDIVGPAPQTPQEIEASQAAMKAKKVEHEKQFEARIQKEMADGLDLKLDKQKRIIPQLSVLYQIKSDIDIGNSESIMILKREHGKSGNVTGGMSTASPAPDYVLQYKGGATYKAIRNRVNKIIDKVENNKELDKNDYKFLDGIYEGGVNQVKTMIAQADTNLLIKKTIDDSKAQSGYQEFKDDEPFTLFEQNNDDIQGSYTPEKRLIKIAKSKTMSTFVHESGHYFFDVIEKIVNSGEAPQGLMDDYMKIREYVGAAEGKVLTVEQHEKFADAFVNYLATGKAPSKGLRKAFHTFKNWLFTVFGGVRLNPALNPEITAVFDRMLASKREIQEQIDELTPVDYGPGFEAEVMNRYNKFRAEVKMDVEDEFIRLELERENKKLSKEYKAREAEVKSAFEDLAKTMRVFDVIDQIKTDEHVDRINRADVDQLGPKFAANFPQSLVKTNGSSSEILASIHGYETAYDMLKDIAEHRDRDQWIKEQTDSEMARLYPELQPKQDLSEDAKKALHVESRADQLIMEIDMFAEKAFPVVEGIARKLIERAPKKAAIRSAAVFAVGMKKVSEIKPHIHRQAEVKFSKEAAKAYVKRDYKAAFEAKKMEAYNFELYNASIAAQEKMQKDKRLYKVLQRSDDKLSKKRELNYINVARAVLKMYGIGPAKKSVNDYLESLATYDRDSYESLSLLAAPVQEAAKPVGEATYAEYLAMNDLVESLWEMAGEAKKITVGTESLSIELVVSILAPQFIELTPAKDNKILTSQEAAEIQKKSEIKNKKALYRRMESWVNSITTKGQKATITDAHKYLHQGVASGEVSYVSRVNEMNKKIKSEVDKIESWFKEEKDFFFKFHNAGLNKEQMLMVLLHSGNESNLRKLVVGHGWGSIKDGVFDKTDFDAEMSRARSEGYLTKEVYDFAQAIGNIVSEMLPETQKAHKKIKGFYFGKVAATPFSNEFGSYDGWYIPAVVDRNQIRDQRLLEKLEADESNQYPSKSIDSGFAADRNENYYGPLSLEFNLLTRHIDRVAKFTYLEPARKDLMKLMADKDLKAAIDNFDSSAFPSIIAPFLERAKSQKIVTANMDQKEVQKIASHLKTATTINIMTGLVSSTLQQFTGVLVTKSKFQGDDGSHIMDAISDFTIGGKKEEMIKFATDNSKWFESEFVNNNFELSKEVEDIVLNKSGYRKAQDFFAKNAFVLQKIAQNKISTIAWHAGYNRYFEHNPNAPESEAIEYADSIVRTTQGTNRPIDVAQSQVADSFYQLSMHFTGYFNMVYNNNIEEFEKIERELGTGGRKTEQKEVRIRKAVVYLNSVVATAIVSQIILQALSGKWFDNDNNGKVSLLEILSAFGFGIIGGSIATMGTNFIYKQIGISAMNIFTKNPVDERMTTPVTAALEKSVAITRDVLSGNRRSMITDGATIAGLITKMPIVPLSKPINYVSDVAAGKAKPTGPIDFTRGLVTGAPGQKK